MRVRTLLAATAAACALLLAMTASSGAVVPRDGWGFGIADDDWNVNWADPNDPGSIPFALEDRFALLGPKTFRLQVEWNATTQSRLMHRAQTIIARARANGVQHVLVTFKRNSYTDGASPPSPLDYELKIRQVVQALAPQVDAWGPANEPNGGIRWLPRTGTVPKAQDGPAILAAYMAALEEVVGVWDPTALTTSPDFVDRKDLGSIAPYVNDYTDAGGTFGDYVAWHPYWGVHNKTTSTTEDLINLVPAGKSIWVTEVGGFGRNLSDGINDGFGATQNNKVWWLTNGIGNHPRVTRIYYYHMRGSANPSSSWDTALLGPDGRPRQAWYTWCLASHGNDYNHPDCRVPPVEQSAATINGNWVGLVGRNAQNAVGYRGWRSDIGWVGWTALGGDTKGRPRLLTWGPGHLDVYARGGNDYAYHRYYTNGQWSGWEQLGTARVTSDVVPVAWANGRVDAFARGAGGDLMHARFDAGQWHDWQSLGGNLVGNPGAYTWGPGHLGVFVRGHDGRLHQRYFANGQWSAWEDLSAGWTITSDPAPISWSNGHVDVYARGGDGSLVHRWFGNGQWNAWENLGAGWKISSAPAPTSWSAGHLDVYARGNDGALTHRWYGGGQWHPWESLGGAIQGEAAPVAITPGHADVFVGGTDNAFHHRWFASGMWNPWAPMGIF